MRIFLGALVSCVGLSGAVFAEDMDSKRGDPTKVIEAYFAAQSGEPNSGKDLSTMQSFLHPNAVIVKAAASKDGKKRTATATPAHAQLQSNLVWWKKLGYYEACVKYEVQQYANVAQVLCPYTWRMGKEYMKENSKVQGIGVAAWTLHHDGEAWKIMSYTFTHETPEQSISARFDLPDGWSAP